MSEPLCSYFGQCGGCSSQNIDYESQLDYKMQKLASCISVDAHSIEVFSDSEYGYRNRMDFIFGPRGLGLRKKGDWKTIIDIENCVISNDKLNKILAEARVFFKGVDFFDIRKGIGTFKYVVIRTPREMSSISFVLNEDSSRTGEAIARIKEFAKSTTADIVVVTYVARDTDMSISSEFFAVKGSDMLKETYLSKEFSYSVQGFFQNNTAMAQKMHEYVRGVCEGYKSAEYSLLDLYAGVGTFGINNSDLFDKVLIVESDANCINAAQLNVKDNSIGNAEVILLDAMNLRKLDLPQKLLVITDPPRSGMHSKTIEQLNRLAPHAMIYISCNIDQLGKDLQKFKEYSIKRTAMFDLFPQTPHVEAIVVLEKSR